MKRRIIMLFLALTLSVSLSACGGEEKAGETAGADTTEAAEEEESVLAHNVEPDDPYAPAEVTNPFTSFDINDYVKLGDYKNIKITLDQSYEITDQDVIDNINYMLSYQNSYEKTDKTTVESGDVANIDYEGKKDGVAFQGGTATGYNLTIGSGTFIPGFEDGLIGVNVGDTVDLNLTFPENYKTPDLAGADVVFTVTVNYIAEKKELSYDTLTDEYVKDNYGAESVAVFYDMMKSSLESNALSSKNTEIRNKAAEKLVEISDITYPDGYIEEQTEQWFEQLRNTVDDSIDMEQYCSDNYNMTVAEVKNELSKEFTESRKQQLALIALADELDIQITDEALNEYMESMVTGQEGAASVEQIIHHYSTSYETAQDYIRRNMRMGEALAALAEMVEVSE